MKDIDKITVDLLDWGKHYPTGAIAYSGDEAIDSEYCDTAEEFKAFFERVGKKMTLGCMRLSINLDVNDLCDHTEKIVGFAHEIREAFLAVLEEGNV